MFEQLERMSNQLPPRLKAVLNLAITVVLVFLSTPYLWSGLMEGVWSDLALGLGLLLIAIFNMFT